MECAHFFSSLHFTPAILKAHEDARLMISNAIVNEIIANHTASFIEDPSETYECEAQVDVSVK